jgi:hypothetical protein
VARTATARVVIKTIDKSSKTIKKIQGNFSKFGSFIAKRFVFTFSDLQRAVEKSFGAIKKGIDLTAQTRVLQQQLTAQGIAFDEYIAKLNEVSAGTVSTAGLIAKSNQALLLGIGADKIAKLLEVARASAAGFGITVEKAFEDITRGIGRASPLILDNIGIIVNLSDEYKILADSLGINVKQLKLSERRQAILNGVLRVAEERVKLYKFAVEGTTQTLQQISAGTANVVNETSLLIEAFFQGATNTVDFEGAFKTFSETIKSWTETVRNAGVAGRLFFEGFREQKNFIGAAIFAVTQYKDQVQILEQRQHLQALAAKRVAEEQDRVNKAQALATKRTTDFTTEVNKLTKAYNDNRKAIDDAIAATGALGIVTSEQLIVEIQQLDFELKQQAILLGATSAEYRLIEKDGVAAIEKLEERIASLTAGLGDLKEGTVEAKDAIVELGIEEEQAGRGARVLANETRNLNSNLRQIEAQVNFTSAAFDRLAQAQGRAAAVTEALNSGGTLVLGGTRVNLPGGGSRLTSEPGFPDLPSTI